MNDSNAWNDMILKAHFQSLNPKWNDQESVVTLLHEISVRLADPKPLSADERTGYQNRINIFIKEPVARKQPLPMKQVGKKGAAGESRNTGT